MWLPWRLTAESRGIGGLALGDFEDKNHIVACEPTQYVADDLFDLVASGSWSFAPSAAAAYESAAQERQLDMKKASMEMADQDIPELKRDQLGKGVRGKYLKHFTQGSNVVVLQPEILKAFPTSEAVNKALSSMLAFAQETQGLTRRVSRSSRKRVVA